MLFNYPILHSIGAKNCRKRIMQNVKQMNSVLRNSMNPKEASRAIKEVERELKILRKGLKSNEEILEVTEFKHVDKDQYMIKSELGAWSAAAHFMRGRGHDDDFITDVAEGNYVENTILTYPKLVRIVDNTYINSKIQILSVED